MKCRSLFASLLFAVLLNTAGWLHADGGAASGDQSLATTLDAFLERYYAANGGKDKLLSVRSMRIETNLFLKDGQAGKLIYVSEQPNLVRSVWYGPRGTVLRRGYNGAQSWEMTTMPDGSEKGHIGTDAPGAFFEWVIANPEACGAKLEFLPMERSERMEYYRVKAVYLDGTMKDYWLDAASLCDVKVVKTHPDGTTSTFIVEKPVKYDGIWFPGVQRELDSKGVEVNRIELLDVQMNIGLLSCLFDPPEELLKAVEAQSGK
jgi:hypothetical protein